MNQHDAGLVHDDVLAKMDALLKKHHDALARGAVVEDFPVLTDVVKDDDVIPLLTEVVEVDTEDSQLGACRTYGDRSATVLAGKPPRGCSQNSAGRGQILPVLQVNSHSIDQENGEIWTAQADSQPIHHKSDRLLAEGEAFSPGDAEDEELDLLDRRIQEMLDQHLPSRIAEAVDKMFPAMLEQFSRQVENMLREAVAQELRQQLVESLRQGHHDDAPE